jgi:hypothetical protein
MEKKNLERIVSDNKEYILSNPITIEVENNGDTYIIKNKELGIVSKSIYNFALEFEEIYNEVYNLKTDNENKKFMDNLGISVVKIKDKKNKKINSRKKGARGERLVIELLKEHFKGLEIYRTPGSGGFSTIKGGVKDSAGNSILSGDLSASNNGSEEYKRFIKFNWEVKNYGKLPNILDIYFKKSEPLIEWIDQCERDSKIGERVFVLIIRSNRSPEFVIFKEEYVKDKLYYNKFLINFRFKNNNYFIYDMKEINFL